jgi:hypothetical protein
VAWKLLIVGGGWVSWQSKPARLKSSPPGLAGQIRSASLPRQGRPLVRLDNEEGAFALSLQVLEDLGLKPRSAEGSRAGLAGQCRRWKKL